MMLLRRRAMMGAKVLDLDGRLGGLAIGSEVKLTVSSAQRTFLVVHQGNPDPANYINANGTWLWEKGLPATLAWNSAYASYDNCAPDQYILQNYLNLLDPAIQEQLMTVTIPYVLNGAVQGGANGLERKGFLLSAYEMGWTVDNHAGMGADGVCLDYFKGFSDTDSRRTKRANNNPFPYWTRSNHLTNTAQVWVVSAAGGTATIAKTTQLGVAPALVLPKTLPVDEDGNVGVDE